MTTLSESPNIQHITVYGSNVYSPTSFTSNNVLSIPSFFSGAKFISSTIATLPRLIKINNSVIKSHPYNYFLNRQLNDYATANDTIETLLFHSILYGNGFAKVIRESDRVYLINIDPIKVTIVTLKDRKGNYKKSYIVDDEVITSEDMIHISMLSYNPSSNFGYDNSQLFSEFYKKYFSIHKFQTRILDGANTIAGTIETTAPLTTEQQNSMRSQLDRKYGNNNGGGSILVLPFGTKFENVPVSNNQQNQIAEIQNITDVQISQILGIPIEALGLSNSTAKSKLSDLAPDLVKFYLKPYISKLENQLNKLLKNKYEYIEVDVNKLLDKAVSNTDNAINKYKSGLISLNEAREMDGLDPIDQEWANVPNLPVSQLKLVQDTNPDNKTNYSKEAAFNIVKPMIDDLINKLETRHNSELEKWNDVSKWDEKYLSWIQEFGKRQSRFFNNSMKSINESYKALSGESIDIDYLSSKYEESYTMLPPGEGYIFDLQKEISNEIL